jgi:AraC family ethanolamine operon transcriptional activator
MSVPSIPARSVNHQLVTGVFDDIAALAASPLDWDQEYEQIGRGQFRGQITQLILDKLQLGRISWAPGVLQRGTAPKNTWVFGLPIKSEGSLHIRRRPVKRGELLIATSRDDAGFTATGSTELMIAAIPNNVIRQWMRVRRGDIGLNPDLPPRHWAVSNAEMARRSRALANLLNDCVAGSNVEVSAGLIYHLESKVADMIFDMIPSAEIIEPVKSEQCWIF